MPCSIGYFRVKIPESGRVHDGVNYELLHISRGSDKISQNFSWNVYKLRLHIVEVPRGDWGLTALRLGLVADIRVLLSHTNHDALMTRSADDRREHGTRSIVSGETGLNQDCNS